MKVTAKGKITIDEWIQAHKPDGIGRLARATKIPSTSLQKVRQGRPLMDPQARQRLLGVLGVGESELFVAVETAKNNRAS